ncbi:MAG: cell division regulator GpsB [Aerococcus sp.]|nr:cell division regulator GpsB [Aerococcus sp.]
MSGRNLTAKNILEKDFKPALRGFNTKEVDEFLNLIIRDYESYDREISYLKAQNERLKQRLKQSDTEPGDSNNHHVQATTNYDIIKRLSRLEKTVYGASGQAESFSDNETNHEDDTQLYTRSSK